MATNYFVDPVGGSDAGGDGSLGNPWQTVQFALNNITRDAVNGDRVNIKAGGADTLAAALSLVTYGTPTATAALWFEGYTSAQGDGGQGEISGGGSVSIISSTAIDFLHFKNLKLGNTGAAQLLRLDDYCSFLNVEFHSSNFANAAVQTDVGNMYERCYFHTFGATTDYALLTINSSVVDHCRFIFAGDGAAIYSNNQNCLVMRNFVRVTNAAAYGISYVGPWGWIIQNSVYNSASGTNDGIHLGNATVGVMVKNNIVQGWSGVGGQGIGQAGTGRAIGFGNNAFYDCETNVDPNISISEPLGSDISLANAPFSDPDNDDFTIAADALAELQAAGFPSDIFGATTLQYLDMGGAQTQGGGGGGGGGGGQSGMIIRRFF